MPEILTWQNPVAIFNVKNFTLHHPSGQCGHISWAVAQRILSWDSKTGRTALREGKVCGSCQSMFNFNPRSEDASAIT